MPHTVSTHADIDEFIATLPIKYSATFIPQSVSRNATDKARSLNWRIVLAPNGNAPYLRSLITDYMQGIGHVPGHKFRPRSNNSSAAQHDAAEKGVYYKTESMFMGSKIPAPALRDVLYSLVLDSSAVDQPFEDWASDFGYDADSRKALSTYETCVKIHRELRALIGTTAINRLQELFADY